MVELAVYLNPKARLVEFNAVFLREGITFNPSWDVVGEFPTLEEALRYGTAWVREGERRGYRRGALTNPHYAKS